jgi:acyl-CoA thioester hydrolase
MNPVRHLFKVMTYDVDFAGVVSNQTYVRWLEDLRNLFAEQTLPIAEAMRRGVVPALMRLEVEYLAPVRFPDVIEGRLWLAEHGSAKWVLAAEFTRQADSQPVARARQTGVFVSRDTLKPVRLPAEFR